MSTSAPPAPTLADPADHARDVAAIEALIADVAIGIGGRDPDRCVARFAADVRSITGARLVGRDAVHRAHVDAMAADGLPPQARFDVVDLLFVHPDVAVATTGAHRAGPDDPIDRDHPPTWITWTLVRGMDGWWVASRHFSSAAA